MTDEVSSAPSEPVAQPEPQSEAVAPVETLALTPAEVATPEPVPALESVPRVEPEVVEIPVPVEPEPPTTEAPPSTPTQSQQSQQSSSTSPAAPSIATHRAAALLKRRANKEERLEKIVVLARSSGKITNNDVQILLAVADATATRYCQELVRAGRLHRSGVPGHAVYEPV